MELTIHHKILIGALIGLAIYLIIAAGTNSSKIFNENVPHTMQDISYRQEIVDNAKQFNGVHAYENFEDNNGAIERSLRLITNENECDNLEKMWDTNTGWLARPYIADKIVKLCYNG